MKAIQSRLVDAVRSGEAASLAKVDADVRAVVAQAISHDSVAAATMLEALRAVYGDLIQTVVAERTRVGAELSALSRGRRGINAYQGRLQG